MTPNDNRPGAAAGAVGTVEARERGIDVPTVPRWIGCPCGCISVPRFLDDPDCLRHAVRRYVPDMWEIAA